MAVELSGIKVALLDIEGTTTKISFVKDKMFGYVRSNLSSYLKNKFHEEEVQRDIKAILIEEKCNTVDLSMNSQDEVLSTVIPLILSIMDQDKKSFSLKQLQGHMFTEAFESKVLVGEMFPDVLPCIRRMFEAGLKIAIYSSGSIHAQKLLFGHTQEGDIKELICGFFDTSVGPKVESSSYVNISKNLGVEVEQILFLTDVAREGRAAEEAGCKVCLVIREENAPLTDQDLKDFECITSFEEVFDCSS